MSEELKEGDIRYLKVKIESFTEILKGGDGLTKVAVLSVDNGVWPKPDRGLATLDKLLTKDDMQDNYWI